MVTFDPKTHTYSKGGVEIPSVTKVLKGCGLIDFSKVPPERLDVALLFGTVVHKTCELYDKNNLDEKSLDPKLRPYLDGWIKFKKDTQAKTESIEEQVYSKLYRYAGTLDRRMILDKHAVVEIKTSVDFHPANRFQLSAYQYAYNEHLESRVGRINDRIAVLLTDEGTYKLEQYRDPMDFNMFLSCLSIYNWKEQNQ